jgi:hypothetical protein
MREGYSFTQPFGSIRDCAGVTFNYDYENCSFMDPVAFSGVAP